MRETLNKIINNNIEFFLNHAYDLDNKTFYSEIDNEGNVLSDKVHIIALSRLLFGLTESSKELEEKQGVLMEKAKECVAFIKTYFTKEDEYGFYYVPTVSNKGEAYDHDSLNLWEQSYGFLGLVNYYSITKDQEILELIHKLFEAYVKRFYDDQMGGFVFNYSFIEGRDYDSKCIQSIMYPVTSFMSRLYKADVTKRAKYTKLIEEMYNLADKCLYNKDRGNIQIAFHRDFTPKQVDGITPGHYFQIAWFYMMVKDFDGLPNSDSRYGLGAHIFRETLKKSWMATGHENGFPESLASDGETPINENRAWWQHAELINAYCHLDKEESNQNIDQIKVALKYFEDTFVDYEIGCEHFSANKEGSRIIGNKGELGKSSYHTIEMCSFILSYLRK